jgi:hypothetical protein
MAVSTTEFCASELTVNVELPADGATRFARFVRVPGTLGAGARVVSIPLRPDAHP